MIVSYSYKFITFLGCEEGVQTIGDKFVVDHLVVGKFELERKIVSGSFREVYLGMKISSLLNF